MPETDADCLPLDDILESFCLVLVTKTVCWLYWNCSLDEWVVGKTYFGVCCHLNLLNDILLYFVPLVDVLGSCFPRFHVDGNDDNPTVEIFDSLVMNSLGWMMILCNHHVVLEEDEKNSDDHDGNALNQ